MEFKQLWGWYKLGSREQQWAKGQWQGLGTELAENVRHWRVVLRHFPNRVLTAIQDYEAAQEQNENDQQIREGLEKAQRLLKQSQKRDYYKILGVKRWITPCMLYLINCFKATLAPSVVTWLTAFT